MLFSTNINYALHFTLCVWFWLCSSTHSCHVFPWISNVNERLQNLRWVEKLCYGELEYCGARRVMQSSSTAHLLFLLFTYIISHAEKGGYGLRGCHCVNGAAFAYRPTDISARN